MDPSKEGDRIMKRLKLDVSIDSFEIEKNSLEKWQNTFSELDFDEGFLEEMSREDIFLRKKLMEDLDEQFI